MTRGELKLNNIDECKAFAKRIANIHVQHARIASIYEKLDSMRRFKKINENNDSPQGLFILGQSGLGKSRTVKKYVELNPKYVEEMGESEIDIMPVVYTELPDPYTPMELYQSIITALGAPRLGTRPTIGDAKGRALMLLETQRTELLIIDEIDYIFRSKFYKPEDLMETLKYIGNSTKIPTVCVGTPKISSLAKLDPQYFRRFPQKELTRFMEVDEEFCSFLNEIEKQISPKEYIGLGDQKTMLPQIFFKMSKGVTSYITQTIQEAYGLLGVFDGDFNDMNNVRLTIDLLVAAYKNLIGDTLEEELEQMIK
jgi:hypothetical protein